MTRQEHEPLAWRRALVARVKLGVAALESGDAPVIEVMGAIGVCDRMYGPFTPRDLPRLEAWARGDAV